MNLMKQGEKTEPQTSSGAVQNPHPMHPRAQFLKAQSRLPFKAAHRLKSCAINTVSCSNVKYIKAQSSQGQKHHLNLTENLNKLFPSIHEC